MGSCCLCLGWPSASILLPLPPEKLGLQACAPCLAMNFFCGTEVWTQGFVLAKQAFYLQSCELLFCIVCDLKKKITLLHFFFIDE
jgi:hypothetical protein